MTRLAGAPHPMRPSVACGGGGCCRPKTSAQWGEELHSMGWVARAVSRRWHGLSACACRMCADEFLADIEGRKAGGLLMKTTRSNAEGVAWCSRSIFRPRSAF